MYGCAIFHIIYGIEIAPHFRRYRDRWCLKSQILSVIVSKSGQ